MAAPPDPVVRRLSARHAMRASLAKFTIAAARYSETARYAGGSQGEFWRRQPRFLKVVQN